MDYLSLVNSKSDFLQQLAQQSRDADNNLERETNGCVNIQRAFRGSVARARITFKHNTITTIARCFRGHCGRKKVSALKEARRDEQNLLLFHCFANILQKYFRGFYSRKYKASHFKRKRFMQNLVQKTIEIREMQYEYSIQQALREEKERQEERDDEIQKITEGLHHLVSTKQIRGIYNPPPQYLQMPTMQEVPVEQHLRGVTREFLRTRGYTKGASTMKYDYNGVLQVPLKGLKHKLSLQASAPYDAVERQNKADKILHDVVSTDRKKKFFVSGGKTDVLNEKVVPLNTGDLYVDPWNNPLLKRGIPKSQHELLESAFTRKALFAAPPKKPFYNLSGGNMSNVAQTTFDVIGEAQETGGVLRRHLGVTSRFGVPDNCDYRPEGGVIPTPPPRSSTLRQTRPNVKKHRISVQSIINSAKMQVGENLAILQLREKIAEQVKEAKEHDSLESSDDESDADSALFPKQAAIRGAYDNVNIIPVQYKSPKFL